MPGAIVVATTERCTSLPPSDMPRVLFFDWTLGGHHELYLDRLVRFLPPAATPVVAAPSRVVASLAPLGIEVIDLGEARPRLDTARYFDRAVGAARREEVRLFRHAIARSRSDLAVHTFADGLLRDLATGPPLPAPAALLLFRPRAHYPRMFDSGLSARERVLGEIYERLLSRWRRRADAHAVLTLDECATERWRTRRGAPAVWLPEPPVLEPAPAVNTRHGAALFGSLGPRKGLDHLAAAARQPGAELSLILAGATVPGFEAQLAHIVSTIRSAGVEVELHTGWRDERAALELLARARCVVLPYVNHYGMSRVLLEATYSGTPVVAGKGGLIGHLVKTHGIGTTADLSDPADLRAAIDRICHDQATWERCHARTAVFAERYSPSSFTSALETALL
jgi:hypothetical protein